MRIRFRIEMHHRQTAMSTQSTLCFFAFQIKEQKVWTVSFNTIEAHRGTR